MDNISALSRVHKVSYSFPSVFLCRLLLMRISILDWKINIHLLKISEIIGEKTLISIKSILFIVKAKYMMMFENFY